MNFNRQHCAVLFIVLCIWGSPMPVLGGTPSEWKDRVVYQLLTDRFAISGGNNSNSNCDLHKYCGGDYGGLVEHLDYIAGLGATALWITPVVDNFPDGYHGYWLRNLYEVNENFGTKAELKQFIQEAHNRGIWVMVDVVANHVGPVDMDFAQVYPYNDSAHYHSKCQITDFNNQQQVEVCRLANLPDLDQNNNFVRESLKSWIQDLVNEYGFDGVRVDTVPEIHQDFWNEFNDAAGVFCMGEVFNGNIPYVAQYQQHLDSVLNYPLFFAMRDAFTNPNSNLQQSFEYMLGPSGSLWSSFKDYSLLGTFLDNHDNARFLHNRNDHNAYKNGLAFTLLQSGIPILYYGSEQGYAGGNDPDNRETLWPNYNQNSDLYQFIAKINQHRNTHKLFNQQQIQRYAASNFYAFSRGSTVLATTNVGSNGPDVSYTMTYLPPEWKDATTICDILTNECSQVSSGKFTVTLKNGLPKVLAPK